MADSKSIFIDRHDDDGRSINRVAFKFRVAFWQDANGGEFVIPEVVSNKTEPPAENDDIGGGKHERYFLRGKPFADTVRMASSHRVSNRPCQFCQQFARRENLNPKRLLQHQQIIIA